MTETSFNRIDRAAVSRRAILGGAALLALGGFRSLSGMLAPSAELWERWQARDPSSTRRLDWSRYDTWLADHVVSLADGSTRVDYRRALSQAAELTDIVTSLARIPVSELNGDEQAAYWINLYNAVTLKTVLDHYPIASIQDIDLGGGGLFAGGPWSAPLVTVEGIALSLNDIEHRILRPIWRDARVHYAVNCAALGCPNLRPRAWRPQSLAGDLDAAAARFVNHPRGVSVRGADGEGQVVVSKIYDWFAEDFGGTEESVLAHLRQYARGETAKILTATDRIGDTAYDWALNDI